MSAAFEISNMRSQMRAKHAKESINSSIVSAKEDVQTGNCLQNNRHKLGKSHHFWSEEGLRIADGL